MRIYFCQKKINVAIFIKLIPFEIIIYLNSNLRKNLIIFYL